MARRGKPNLAAVVPELGLTGLKQYGGYVREEFLRDLQGPAGMRIYREMRDNSAVIGASLNAIEMVIRQVKWEVEPPADAPSNAEKDRAEFVEECLGDMTFPWAETIAEHLSMLTFGFATHEIVYKERAGENDAPDKCSKYDDGLIGWSKLPLRPQETLQRWEFASNGDMTGMWQFVPWTFGMPTGNSKPGQTDSYRFIPIGKLLNFRAKSDKNNPEGRSVLRNAYFSWYFSKRIQELEGIGVERDLAGLPMMQIPAECMAANAPPELAAVYDMAKEIVQNVRNDDEAGIVLPSLIKDNQNLYSFKLLSTGGTRSVDTSKIIERLERRMAQTLLADFILMGHEGVGSFALSNDKTDLFSTALGGWLDTIADLYNHKAIPQLMKVNGWPTDRCPVLKHGDILAPALGTWGDFVQKMVASNVIVVDDGVEKTARKLAELPDRDPSEAPRELPGRFTDPNAPPSPQTSPIAPKPPAGDTVPPPAPTPKPPGDPMPAPPPNPPGRAEVQPGLSTRELLDAIGALRRDMQAAEKAADERAEAARGVMGLAMAALERPQAPMTFNVAAAEVQPPAEVTVNVAAAPVPPPIVIPPATVTVEAAGPRSVTFSKDPITGAITGAVADEKEN